MPVPYAFGAPFDAPPLGVAVSGRVAVASFSPRGVGDCLCALSPVAHAGRREGGGSHTRYTLVDPGMKGGRVV